VFSRVARRVARRKPIVAVKSGRQESAGAATEVAVDALFRQTGVIRVDTLEQLFDVALALSTQPLPAGRRVAVVGNAGGPLRLAVDALEGEGLRVCRQNVLAAEAGPEDYEAAVDAAMADDGIDAALVSFVPPVEHTADVAAAVARAAAASAKPVLANFMSPQPVRGLPSYVFPEAAAMALARLVERAEWLARPEGEVPEPDGIDLVAARLLVESALARSPGGDWLGDDEAAALLAHFGIPLGPVGAGVETTVSVLQEPSFGPVIRLGVGGPVAELIGDHAARILPLTDVDAAQLVRSLRASALLFGWRDAPAAAVDKLEDLLLRVSTLAEDVPHVAEAVLDPVLVTPDAAVVVSARIRLAPYQPHPELALRRLR
jgi:acyl-CoA synthetase (NDP forming)